MRYRSNRRLCRESYDDENAQLLALWPSDFGYRYPLACASEPHSSAYARSSDDGRPMPANLLPQPALSFAPRGGPGVLARLRGLTRVYHAARARVAAPPRSWWLASVLVVLLVLFFLALLLEPTVGRGGR